MKFVKVFAFMLMAIALVLSRKVHKKHRKIGGKKQFNENCSPNLIESLTDILNDDCADGMKCQSYESGKGKCKKIGGQTCESDYDCYDKKCTSFPLIRHRTCDTKLLMAAEKCFGAACKVFDSIHKMSENKN